MIEKQGFNREIQLGDLPLKKGGVLRDAVLTAHQISELNARPGPVLAAGVRHRPLLAPQPGVSRRRAQRLDGGPGLQRR